MWFKYIFVIAALVLLYTYLIYPILLLLLAVLKRFLGRNRNASLCEDANSVSVVICVKDAKEMIEFRIKNLLSQQGIPDGYEILIASDGSTDGTAELVRNQFGSDTRVKLVEFAQSRGKAAVLNEIIPQCKGDYIILGDVRQEYKENAVAEICKALNSPSVGAVSGELVFRETGLEEDTSRGVIAYWGIEKCIRKLESAIDSTCGCTGAIYGIKRSLFHAIDTRTVLDDVAIPMLILMDGYKVVFCDSAIAYDSPSSSRQSEQKRKIRTLAGNYQLCAIYPQLINPLKNRIWFQFVSHKLMRLLCPWMLLVLFLLSAAWSFSSLVGLVFFVVQLLFYVLAVAGIMTKARSKCWLTSLPAGFLFLNIAAIKGLICFASGGLKGSWEPTDG